jgi:hypothetical protein
MWKKWMLLAITAITVFLGDVRSARAMESSCNTELLNCYYRAASIDSFWYRWAAGLDCEFAYVECARKTLLGG